MLTITKKDKKRDRGVAVGANLGLIATMIMAARGWFAERKRQREIARRKRERKARRARFTVQSLETLVRILPIVIAALRLARLIIDIRNRKKSEQEEDTTEESSDGVEIVEAEPVASEEEVYEKVNSESPENP
ncbi:MAG: hypothetical protein LUG86_02980 [Oscillospiraceae bacterium]|nr:hypothetical protein [Oscillospiraceae bacterium]